MTLIFVFYQVMVLNWIGFSDYRTRLPFSHWTFDFPTSDSSIRLCSFHFARKMQYT